MRPRRIALVILAVPVLGAAVLGAQALIALNRDYLRTADFDIDLELEGDEPAIRIAVLGDSLVEGVGATSPEASLPGQIGAKVAEQTGRAVHVRGFGVSGAETRDVHAQLDQVEAGEFDVIVIEIGSNDVTHGTRLAELEGHTAAILKRATKLAPHVVFGSAGRMDTPNFLPPLRQVIVHRATQVREVQARVAHDAGVDFMNVAEEVSPIYERTPNANSSDDFHPGDAGYEVWARPLAKRVVERIELDQEGSSP